MHSLSCWAIIYLFTSYEVDGIKLFIMTCCKKMSDWGQSIKIKWKKIGDGLLSTFPKQTIVMVLRHGALIKICKC